MDGSARSTSASAPGSPARSAAPRSRPSFAMSSTGTSTRSSSTLRAPAFTTVTGRYRTPLAAAALASRFRHTAARPTRHRHQLHRPHAPAVEHRPRPRLSVVASLERRISGLASYCPHLPLWTAVIRRPSAPPRNRDLLQRPLRRRSARSAGSAAHPHPPPSAPPAAQATSPCAPRACSAPAHESHR